MTPTDAGAGEPGTAAGRARMPDRRLVEKYAAEGDRTYGMVPAEDVLLLFHRLDEVEAAAPQPGERATSLNELLALAVGDIPDRGLTKDTATAIENCLNACATDTREPERYRRWYRDSLDEFLAWRHADPLPAESSAGERALREALTWALAIVDQYDHHLRRGMYLGGFTRQYIDRKEEALAALAHQQPTEGGQG